MVNKTLKYFLFVLLSLNITFSQISIASIIAKEIGEKVIKEQMEYYYWNERLKAFDPYDGRDVIYQAVELAKNDVDEYYNKKVRKYTDIYERKFAKQNITPETLSTNKDVQKFNEIIDDIHFKHVKALEKLDRVYEASVEYYMPYWEEHLKNRKFY